MTEIKQYIIDNPLWWKFFKYNKDQYKILVHQYVLEHTKFLKHNAELKQRTYCIINNIVCPPLCKSPDCNVEVNWCNKNNSYYEYCSLLCALRSDETKTKKQKTNKIKYGGAAPASCKTVRDKMVSTMKLRYGVENAHQSRHFLEKMQDTIKQKYNVDNVSKCESIKQKKKETFIKNYGVDHYFKTQQFKDFVNSDEFRNKFNNDYIAHKTNKYFEITGVNNPTQLHIGEENIKLLNDPKWLIEQHHTNKLSLTEIGLKLNVNRTTVSNALNKFNISIKKYSQSAAEREICNWLTPHFMIKIRDNDILKPYELDIFIPELNLAIEYCGLFWHSERMGKTNNYHKRKYDLCKSKGIKLLTIFEDEYSNNKELLKDKILTICGKTNKDRVYARKCTIKPVNTKDKTEFFNSNHIQGDGPSSINFGLYNNDKLVACIGFIKGKQYTLNRYATSCNVVGGFSKLLTHFERLYNNPPIITFADLRWSDGDLYKKTGFTEDSILDPDYSYCINENRYHKFSFRHKQMKNKLKNYDPNLSESKNMYNHGFSKIWDCGKIKFIKNKQ